MPLMQWNDSFSVGHQQLDGQHQELVNILNQFFDAMKGGHAADVQRDILTRLVKYTQQHFTYEEQEMRRVDYPDLAAHQEKHRKLIAEVSAFVTEFNDGKKHKHVQMMQFLKDWLVNHIQQADKAYAPYFTGATV